MTVKKEREKEGKESCLLLSVWCFQGDGGCKCLKYLSYLDTIGFDCTRHGSPTPPTSWRAGGFPSCHLHLTMESQDDEEILSQHVTTPRNSTVSVLEYKSTQPHHTYIQACVQDKAFGGKNSPQAWIFNVPVKRHEFFIQTKSKCKTLLYVTCFARKLPLGNATKVLICELHLDRLYRRQSKVMKRSCVFFMKAAPYCSFFSSSCLEFSTGFQENGGGLWFCASGSSTMAGTVWIYVETRWGKGTYSE